MNQEQQYIETASLELLVPTFEVTKQYLAVMEVKKNNGVPEVARINVKNSDDVVSVYFPIKNERFFIVVTLKTKSKIEVNWVWIESGHRVYLTATSKKYTYQELKNYIALQPLSGWSKNDLRPSNTKYGFSRISYEPNTNEAYGLEEKLLELLESLEKDKEEILKLGKQASAVISVCKQQYISANAGIHLDIKTINKLQKLNLSLDIDTCISGTEIVDFEIDD